jgi:hypothetical protein
MADVEEEEEVGPEAPRDLPVDNDSDELCAQPQARPARRLALDGVVELPSDVRSLLAQGLRSIYDDNDKYIQLPEAMECAFRAAIDAKAVVSDTEPKLYPKLWHQAMVREMEAHLENGTWELVTLPHGRKAIGSKWVFKVKCNPNGIVERYKARRPTALQSATQPGLPSCSRVSTASSRAAASGSAASRRSSLSWAFALIRSDSSVFIWERDGVKVIVSRV